jgi:hypothetical protein
MSKIFYDYKIVSYKRDELFLQVGKSGKRVHPGQTVQLRNSSDREKTLNAKQRMLEMPASRWLSQPGYDCLLAFLNGHTADRGRGVGVEPSRILETKVHRNDLSEKVIFLFIP